MKIFQILLDFYLRSSLHVAINLVSLFLVFNYFNVYGGDWEFLLLLFTFTVAGYNWIKYGSLLIRRRSFRFDLPIIILTAVCGNVSTYLLFQENWQVWLLFVAIGVISFWYGTSIGRIPALRNMPVVKLVAVALVWVLLIAIVPAYSNFTEHMFNYSCGLTPIFESLDLIFAWDVVQLFLFVFALCIPFEIRDLKYDEHTLGTLPQLMGIRKTNMLGVLICLICILMEWGQFYFQGYDLNWIATGIYALTAVLIVASTERRPDYYASLIVEAVPGFWVFVVLMNDYVIRELMY